MESALARQLQALCLSPTHQLVDQPVIHDLRRHSRCRPDTLLLGRAFSLVNAASSMIESYIERFTVPNGREGPEHLRRTSQAARLVPVVDAHRVDDVANAPRQAEQPEVHRERLAASPQMTLPSDGSRRSRRDSGARMSGWLSQ
jgi:hypothetical protein